jgi:hypothetical protein
MGWLAAGQPRGSSSPPSNHACLTSCTARQALEALSCALLHAEHRKAAFGRGRTPEQYRPAGSGAGGAEQCDMSSVVRVSRPCQHCWSVPRPNAVHATNLTPLTTKLTRPLSALPHRPFNGQIMTQGPIAAAPGGASNADASVDMLMELTPEARIMMLSSLPLEQRVRWFRPSSERAGGPVGRHHTALRWGPCLLCC